MNGSNCILPSSFGITVWIQHPFSRRFSITSTGINHGDGRTTKQTDLARGSCNHGRKVSKCLVDVNFHFSSIDYIWSFDGFQAFLESVRKRDKMKEQKMTEARERGRKICIYIQEGERL